MFTSCSHVSRTEVVLAAVLLFSFSGVAAVQTSSASPLEAPAPPVRAVSLRFTGPVTLAEAVARLHRETGMDIVADAFPDDPVVPTLAIENAAPEEALSRIAGVYGRELLRAGDVYVLRHRHWYVRAHTEAKDPAAYAALWGERKPGGVTVRRAGEPKSPKAAGVDPARLNTTLLPPTSVSLSADAARAEGVVSKLSEEGRSPITLERRLHNRRVSATLSDVSPGQAVEALALLLGVSQEVSLARSGPQKELEELLVAAAYDQRSDRGKASDALLSDLVRTLTPEQRQRWEQGKEVAIAFGSLSPDLRKRAEGYMQLSYSDIRQRIQGLPEPDPDRLSQCSLVLLPPPSNMLGVDIFDRTGKKYAF